MKTLTKTQLYAHGTQDRWFLDMIDYLRKGNPTAFRTLGKASVV